MVEGGKWKMHERYYIKTQLQFPFNNKNMMFFQSEP